MEDNEIAEKRHQKRKTYCTVMRLLRLFAAILAPFVAYDAPYQYNAMSLHLRGERPSVVFSLSFRAFRAFRGFNCCFWANHFGHAKLYNQSRRVDRVG